MYNTIDLINGLQYATNCMLNMHENENETILKALFAKGSTSYLLLHGLRYIQETECIDSFDSLLEYIDSELHGQPFVIHGGQVYELTYECDKGLSFRESDLSMHFADLLSMQIAIVSDLSTLYKVLSETNDCNSDI